MVRRVMVRRVVVALALSSLVWAGIPAAADQGIEYRDILDCDAGVAAAGAEPVGFGPCPGVRPGAWVATPSSAGCTFNFLFEGFREEDGQRVSTGQYIGTAGHCVGDGDFEEVWADGEGPWAEDAQRRRIGHVVYGARLSRSADNPRRDFALIKLLPDIEANPAMCHWGGPSAINADTTSDRVELKHFGQGVGMADTIPGRTAVAGSMPDANEVFAMGVVTFGDSGSGVISADGRALGVAVTVGLHGSGPVTHTGTVGITRIAPQIVRAGELLGLDFELVTAPLS